MKTIVVAGDLIQDYNLVQYPITPGYHSDPLQQTVLHHRAGGAWYLEDMVRLACADLLEGKKVRIHGVQRDEKPPVGENVQVSQAYSIWSLHEQNTEKSAKEQVWRSSQFLGCQPPSEEPQPVPMQEDVPDPDLLVLDDLGLGFRRFKKLWPAALKEGGNPQRIVLKTAPPLEGPLWEKLLSASYADRLTVVLSVAALRARRAAISQSLSWDRTIEETIHEFEGLSALDLGRCRRVIVHFGGAGAASFTRCRFLPSEQESWTDRVQFERFLYHPDELEGSWIAKRPGKTFGATAIFTAAVVRHELQPQEYPLYIALGRGLAAMQINHDLGGGSKDFFLQAANEPIKQMFRPPAELEPQKAESADSSRKVEKPEAVYCTAYPHSLLADPVLRVQAEGKSDLQGPTVADPQSQRPPAIKSDLLQDLTGTGLEYVAAKATDVVLRGPHAALRAAPKARYGNYLTVDREEIERINSIRSLILAYQENLKDHRPLSLTVFGPPGSGKSFAIKELAAELFGARKAILEFNLSQFQSVHDLHTAFHQVRDASVQGQIPLVFWDEFDTALGGHPLGWLKEFLAPMQDAKFQAGSLTHPFGKAIFVFAGGTCPDLQSFDKSNDHDEAKKDQFRAVKGPDFISRLRGFVNIKGPNPVARTAQEGNSALAEESPPMAKEPAEQDVAHLIRRAVLLRSVLERSYPHLVDQKTGMAAISTSVIRGFLRVKEFLHGARSLEAIVNMSALTHAQHFGVAELPAADLLRLHVAEDFLKHVQEGQLEVAVIEAIAEDSHERWRKKREEALWTWGPVRDDKNKKHPMLRPYIELSEPEKEKNRLPARLTQAKLAEAGYRIQRQSKAEPTSLVIPTFSPAEYDKLMRIEHDIWLRDHLLDGYEWAEESNDYLRLHRDIAPLDKVPPEDQSLDRENIDSIPAVLSKLGYTLVKDEQVIPMRRV